MAGSLTYREYTADNGISYSIKIDESNANCTVTNPLTNTTSGALCKVRTANLPTMPAGMKPRYCYGYLAANVLVKRKFIVGDPTLIPSINTVGATGLTTSYPSPTDTSGTSVGWIMSNVRGEKSRKAPSITAPDTGLTDGTVTQ